MNIINKISQSIEMLRCNDPLQIVTIVNAPLENAQQNLQMRPLAAFYNGNYGIWEYPGKNKLDYFNEKSNFGIIIAPKNREDLIVEA
jgi:hypothetical protein